MLLALCGALVHYFNHVAPGVISSDRRLKDATNALMARLQYHDGRWSMDTGADARPSLPSQDSIAYAINDMDGRLLIGNAAIQTARLDNETGQMFAMSPFEGRYIRTLATRFDTPSGIVVITVADIRSANEPVARLGLMSTLLWDFVQLDMTLVLVWVGIQLGLRPMKRLRDEIAERSPLDLRPIGESSVPREIAPVVVTLNRLFKTLRSSVQSQQQFIANAAHQLRTPITGMQAQLDLLAAEPAAAPIKHRLTTLQEGIRQLSHSANQLLTLARVDPTVNIAAKNQSVDLRAIAGEVIARFFDRALQLNIDLGADAEPASILADPAIIDDLTSNLVDNALKYTPAGGSVTVSTGMENGRPFLAVEDTGPGIPESERQRVRQRFYRLPNSPGHGSGLGLAIVDEIAQMYGASFEITAGANGLGTKAKLLFP
jgi:two-component system sensor histidine kinase TctE